ncbi:porin family protein [Hymenobacter arizonensis]|uniref:Outer membrane protein beta-barrel domain-containing protein n=1 Tax=Hymenobacter arizonensis TaxID=1227077 RepID=A0A1I5YBM6_HYMAR|nr:porin family protein [Hymenobacter arizonensis]SFQ41598.1 Outer membrane protein beta-barrel domain-containing protein [Hymenobacter arizonensis]
MKKVILSLGLLAGVATAAQAQEVRFGLKGGVNYSTITSKDDSDAESKIGLLGGVFANFGLSDLISIQPEVLYSQKGAQMKDMSDVKVKLNYIDVPVLVKVNAGGLFFEGGPQVGFLTTAKVTNGSQSEDFKENVKSVDFGYAVGLGYQAESGPMIGLRYNGGISDINKNNNNDSDKSRNSAFQLYVGFAFGGK